MTTLFQKAHIFFQVGRNLILPFPFQLDFCSAAYLMMQICGCKVNRSAVQSWTVLAGLRVGHLAIWAWIGPNVVEASRH